MDITKLVRKYDRRGPRYTSYPTAVDFDESFAAADYEAALQRADAMSDEPWSIYFHIPFCHARCTFCACSVIVSPDPSRVSVPYVEHLEREMEMVAKRIENRRRVAQLHWGGGTPTYLDPPLIQRLSQQIHRHFELLPDAEIAIEVDPRVTNLEHLEMLARCGFNRVSAGVQDFDEEVQEHIGRGQSFAATQKLCEGARRLGFEQVNFDLVYGLPGQTRRGLSTTMDLVENLRPDRIALYGYAHLPRVRGNQRAIDAALLPDAQQRLELWLHARARLQGAGYLMIGMDHYALPEDPLAQAASTGRLHRNFMGYTVMPASDILGFGVTSIGEVRGAYVQTTKKLSRYYRALEAGELPVERGLRRSADDEIRRRVIMDLMCCRPVRRSEVEAEFGLESFDERFAEDLAALGPMLEDGLVTDDGDEIVVTEPGRVFVRNIAMCFDARLREREQRGERSVFSRAI
jgi:oxygen-independent coproporphyrinogen-3 oxidase